MPTLRRAALAAVLLPLAAGLAACRSHTAPAPAATSAAASPSAAATPPAISVVAATVDGETIPMAEVDRTVLEQYAHDQMFDLRKRVLDQMIAERLLTREAKGRGLTREALLKQEVEGKVPPPSPEDVKLRYQQSGLAAQNAPFEIYRDRIAQNMRDQAMAARQSEYLDELRKKGGVTVLLTEPRFDVVIPADAPALGPAQAPVTVVEYLDYQCPYCHRVQGVVDQVLAAYKGKLRFVHRDFPLESIHSQAMKAARAARCAGDQGKFWEYHRSLLVQEGQEDADLTKRAAALKLDGGRFAACLASDAHDAAIRAGLEQGRAVGVNATPTFFVNGRRLVGGRDVQEFKKVIDEELAKS